MVYRESQPWRLLDRYTNWKSASSSYGNIDGVVIFTWGRIWDLNLPRGDEI